MRKAACGAQMFGIFYDEKVCMNNSKNVYNDTSMV